MAAPFGQPAVQTIGGHPVPKRSTASASTEGFSTAQTERTPAARPGDLVTLAVVEASRPVDVVASLRWAGACNDDERDLVSMCGVLRSWEERFGATVVWIGGATLLLTVRPAEDP